MNRKMEEIRKGFAEEGCRDEMILSILVDMFSSKIPMFIQQPSWHHKNYAALPPGEPRHWRSRPACCSNSPSNISI